MRPVGDGLVLRPGLRFWLAVGMAVGLAGLTACSSPRNATGKASTSGTVSGRTQIQVVTPRTARTTTAAPVADPRPSRNGAADSLPSTTAVATTAVTATTGPAVPACDPADLEVAFDVQPRGGTQPADRTRALVVVTDLSSEGCQLEGFAAVDAVEGGRRLPVKVRHVDLPGPPSVVEVPAGGSAFAGIEWTAMTGCPEVSALEVALPAWGAAQTVDVIVPGGSDQPLVVCSADVLVAPFAAMSEGTVAFPDSVGAGT